MGGIFGALRFIWSFLLEKFSYKLIYGILLVFQIIIGVCLPLALDGDEDGDLKKGLFFGMVALGFFCEGGHFVLLPTVLA
jgi:hypothetical protein